MSRNGDFQVGSSPVEAVSAASQRYAHEQGFHLPEANYSRVVMPASASHALGAAYDRMPEFDKSAVPAYRALKEETGRQYDLMTRPRAKGGLGLSVEVQHEDPYGADDVNKVFGEFRGDVVNNHRMKVLSTQATGGHPIFSNDDNDMFRAVHDVFGHLGSGRGVDFDGEEAAYQKHSRMYSPLARQALATETRGQNSALRLHGSFQDQKVGVLPEHMQGLQFGANAPDRAQAAERARAKNVAQGIL